jgi:hypothetical protein
LLDCPESVLQPLVGLKTHPRVSRFVHGGLETYR